MQKQTGVFKSTCSNSLNLMIERMLKINNKNGFADLFTSHFSLDEKFCILAPGVKVRLNQKN